MRRVRLVSVMFAAVVGLGGCASSGPEPTGVAATPTATLPAPGLFCPDLAATGTSLRITNSKGYSIAAVEFGTGPNVIVLAHQAQADLCQWLPFADELRQKGYRTIALSFAGSGSSTYVSSDFSYVEDITAVVDHARSAGATKVILLGASMGATFSIAAAAAITPPVDGVIALSPPGNYGGVNGYNAAGELAVPALVAAADDDYSFSIDATAYDAAIKPGLATLLVVHGFEHGVSLVEPGATEGTKVRTAVFAFLTAHLG